MKISTGQVETKTDHLVQNILEKVRDLNVEKSTRDSLVLQALPQGSFMSSLLL